MSDLTFKTALTEDEIDKNFENFDMFSELMGSLEECLEYEKGNTKKAPIVHRRNPQSEEVVFIRHSVGMTQKAFAEILGVSKRTVGAWELGRLGKQNPVRRQRNCFLYLKKILNLQSFY